jgi:hypothetical protein
MTCPFEGFKREIVVRLAGHLILFVQQAAAETLIQDFERSLKGVDLTDCWPSAGT